MKKHHVWALLSSIQFLGFSALSQNIQFDLMATDPRCRHAGQESTWCIPSDRASAAKRAGLEKRVVEILDQAQDPKRASVKIGYLSFSNSAIYNKLCDLGKKGISVEGFFDSDNKKDTASMPMKLARDCQGETGDNVRVHYLGRKEIDPETKRLLEWRLHHNKFLIVDSGDTDTVSINFSSGNASSSGLSLHFDHWVMTQATKQSDFAQTHSCVVKSLVSAVDPDGDGIDAEVDSPKVYKEKLNECFIDQRLITQNSRVWVEKALKRESIATLMSPNNDDVVARTLIDQIDGVVSGGKINGAIQHFLHQGIAKALQRAVARGVKVQMVMDDDVITGGTDVPGVEEFYRKFLDSNVAGIQVQFLQTNTEARQMMHHKFLILEGVNRAGQVRVFSGAGQFTTSAMKNNYENFYLSQDDGLTKKYQKLFRDLWSRSLSESKVLGN